MGSLSSMTLLHALRRRSAGGFGLILCALVLAACVGTTAPPRQETLRIATGTAGGGFYPLGERLVQVFARWLPTVAVETQPSAGAVSNLTAVERGDADIGLAFADVAYIAFVGALKTHDQPFKHLRAIAVLQLTPVHLVVSSRSGIRTVADLRGKRVGLGPSGSGTVLTATLVLKAFGIDVSDIRSRTLGFNEGAAALRAGELDAMFDNANYPVDWVKSETSAGAHLIPLSGPAIEQLRRAYPFLRPASIPRGTYTGQPSAIHTIGVDTVLVCRRDMPEAVAYDVTRAIFEALPGLTESMRSPGLLDLEQAAATPIPLHDGAARYFRERELLR
jgi:TRAP transporter TAXI family solute receptor